jgi:ribonuclease HII
VSLRFTLGLDEAGRGPRLGPMVLAAVCLDSRAAAALTRAGLRDSKRFGSSPQGRAARARLAQAIRTRARFVALRVVDVSEIDRRVRVGELNVLEREVADALILRAPASDRILADGARLFGPLRERHPTLEAWNEGEDRHASVAAASVIAKVRRDELWERIAARYAPLFGPIDGGGYTNAATRRFLRAYAARFRRLPPEARRSWPHHDLEDLLGKGFDPFDDAPHDRAGQLALI